MGELAQYATPSLGGLCALFVLLVLTGRLIPKPTVDRELARADKETATWKEAYELQRKANELRSKDEEILGLLRALAATPRREQAP